MIMFSFVKFYCRDSVFLPDRGIYLSFAHSGLLDLHFLRMECYSQEGKKSNSAGHLKYGLKPFLEKYIALPYKRQSSINESEEKVLSLRNNSFGFPWSDDYVSLGKMRSFYSNCKKYYAVIAHRSTSTDRHDENVLILFDRYSDAISLAREYDYGKVRSLLGSDFKPYYKSWYPHICVDHMGHPICLFADIDSYANSYSLGSNWCYYFLRYLRNDFDSSISFNSCYGFIQRDKFSQIVCWDS